MKRSGLVATADRVFAAKVLCVVAAATFLRTIVYLLTRYGFWLFRFLALGCYHYYVETFWDKTFRSRSEVFIRQTNLSWGLYFVNFIIHASLDLLCTLGLCRGSVDIWDTLNFLVILWDKLGCYSVVHVQLLKINLAFILDQGGNRIQ